jgi:hypothetical protein
LGFNIKYLSSLRKIYGGTAMNDKGVDEVLQFIGQKGPVLYRARNMIQLVFVAVLMAGGSLLAMYFFGSTINLHCERDGMGTINCTQDQNWLGLVEGAQKPIAGLQRAVIQENYDDDGSTYRVALRTAQGVVPLSGAYTSGYEDKAELASRINAFLNDPAETTLDVSTGVPIAGVLFSVSLVFVGPVMALVIILRRGKPFGRQEISQPYAQAAEPARKDDFWD